ncbi:MAG: hypothetical protein AAF152_02150 [Cyanobacteria bacterium P01_A01_bin.114]
MPDGAPPITFYIPPAFWPQDLPTDANQNWPGFGLGIYAWTIQTALRLQAYGFPCQLSDRLPKTGILLFHSNALRAGPLRPSPQRLPICIKAEALPCPYTPLHIVQNQQETRLGQHYFMPHWPQPGLLRRDRSRGNRFETIAFLGHRNSLAPALQAQRWRDQLAELDLTWQPIVNENAWHDYTALDSRWHDYRQIDAIVAIRSFDQRRYSHKPATKLYNAWLAEVPAILGPESAYRATGHSGRDYLEADSSATLIHHLKQLKRSTKLRKALVNEGIRQVKLYQPQHICQKWCDFLEQVAIPAYDRWCTQPNWRRWQLTQAGLHGYSVRVQGRLMRLRR